MASLKGTKRRITSVKNTQKITRAMKLVASAKYAKAQSKINSFKQYEEQLKKLTSSVLLESQHVLVCGQEEEDLHNLLVVLSSDRGLCGPLNANLLREAGSFLEARPKGQVWELEAWGSKAGDFCKKREEKLIAEEQKTTEKPTFAFAKKAFLRFYKLLKAKSYGSVYIAYPTLETVLSQPPVICKLLPMEKVLKDQVLQVDEDILLEPERDKIQESLLISYGACFLYGVLLAASASENAARMTAMDSATGNADKVIKELTLEYNRARQAAITTELIEITSGVEALH